MKPYPEYRDSEIKWVREIPISWQVKNLKYAVSNLDFRRIPLSSSERAKKRGNIPYYGATGIIDYIDDYVFEGKYILVGEDGGPFFIANKDVSFIADGKFWVNNHAHILKAKESCISEFISYYLNCVDYSLYISGSTRDKLTQGDLSSIRFVSPPIPDQKQISDYLDHKTAKIDSLIEKKKRLIELLKEERTAVINQAVTKGLDPNVPMKDSGIEWLGEIPAHWGIIKLKFLAKIKYGLGQPPKQLENGLPIIRATNVSKGKIITKGLMFIDPDDVPYDRDPVLRTNDMIVVRSGAYTADSAIIPKEFDGAITGYDMVVRSIKANPNFIGFVLLSNYVLDNQLIPLSLRAAQPHLNAEELGSSNILIPPQIEEQISIVKHIEKETSRIDSIISKSEKEIELLQEYRTALISEVVTGKIDVREEKI